MARCTKIVTTTGAVTATLLGGASIFYGISSTSAEAATFFVKLWWEGTGTAPPSAIGGTQSTTLPTAGTTVPHLVIPVPTTGLVLTQSSVPLNNGGRIWYWITKLGADSDTTVLVTGGDNVTFIYD